MGICIYCGTEGTLSPEHYLPDALGDFGTFQILEDRVCHACNNEIGSTVETQFLRTGPIGFFRWILGIEGTNGQTPTPFYRGAGGAPPILTYGRAPGQDTDLLWEIEWATLNAYPARQIVFNDPILGTVPLLITDRMMSDHTLLRPAALQRGIPDVALPHQAWARDDEMTALEDLVQHAYGQLPPTLWQTPPEPTGSAVTLATLVQVGPAFFRAIAKIVFHYALKVLPDLDGRRPEFERIREYIFHGAGGAGVVLELPRQFVGNFQAGERPQGWSHLLFVERTYQHIVGYAQFFVGPESLPFPFQVHIGRNPARLIRPTERHAHAFAINAIEGGGRPHGPVHDLHPMAHIVTPY